jgi:hypothetical protein
MKWSVTIIPTIKVRYLKHKDLTTDKGATR